MSIEVAVIGGGAAGVSAALRLAHEGCRVTLFEKEAHLISGPPFCHLHAGGNLYREIDDAQCRTLLRQSIDFARAYPFCVDYRPTLIAVPLRDESDATALLPRLEMLRDTYARLVEKDPANAVLGTPESYFETIDRDTFERLRRTPPPYMPRTPTEWAHAAAHLIDANKVHFPLILVQEYGLNLFRLAAGATMALQAHPNVTLRCDTAVTNVVRRETLWELHTSDGTRRTFDYLVNAAGFRTGTIDEMAGLACTRMVEFKAAYVAKWDDAPPYAYPEIIFHGKRGTPRGMGQFTPYPGGYVQLHAMRKDVTLYEDGLVAAPANRCQPPLAPHFIEKIEQGWRWREVDERTRKAVAYLSEFVPSFARAQTGAKPLYGAQQIPGDDPDLRVAEAAFPMPGYARCEIVKVSSVGDMSEAIVEDMVRLGMLEANGKRHVRLRIDDEAALARLAREIAATRGYPEAMATRNVARP